MTGLTLFGSAVGICVGAIVLSPILKAFGKTNLDIHMGAIAEVGMIGIMIGGVWMVLNMLMTMFGVNIPVGFDAVDKLFTLDIPKKWW